MPTMDVADWGRRQHELHGRIAPTRATESGVPIFRLASSGISQLVNRSGKVLRSAPFPGDGAVMEGQLEIRHRGRLPADHWLAPVCAWLAGIVLCGLAAVEFSSSRRTQKPPTSG